MIYKKFGLLFGVLLTIFLTSENPGDTHPAQGSYDFIFFGNGGAYTYEYSNDVSPNNHDIVSSNANVSISLHPLMGVWAVSASANADVEAVEDVKWIIINGLATPVNVWPRGEYYLHARIEKRTIWDNFSLWHLVI